jgi:hypothetical protein
MKSARITAGVVGAGLLLAGVATAGPAAASSATCGLYNLSSDGHSVWRSCSSSSGWTQFEIHATACGPGSCTTLTSSWTHIPGTATINAGSGYIDPNSLSITFR